MLTCRDVADKASMMVDGELGLRERVAVRLHLLICSECRRFVRQLKTLVDSLASRSETASQPAPEEFVRKTIQTLDSTHDTSQ